MSVIFEDSRLTHIREKVERGERLTFDDGMTLSLSPDLLAIGYLANAVRERMHGDRTYFEVSTCEAGDASVCTLSYGAGESDRDRIEKLLSIRDRQDTTQSIVACALRPSGAGPETSGFLDLKTIAIARLLLDNVAHIRTNCLAMTPRIAQIAMRFGADDLDATALGGQTSQTRKEVLRLIREAGREPIEREVAGQSADAPESAFTVLV